MVSDLFCLLAGLCGCGRHCGHFPLYRYIGTTTHFWLKYVITLVLLIPVMVLYFLNRRQWIFALVPLLLVARVAFNFFVMPDRIRTGTDLREANGARVVGE